MKKVFLKNPIIGLGNDKPVGYKTKFTPPKTINHKTKLIVGGEEITVKPNSLKYNKGFPPFKCNFCKKKKSDIPQILDIILEDKRNFKFKICHICVQEIELILKKYYNLAIIKILKRYKKIK